MNLVPLKVTIGLRTTGNRREHDHPEFNLIPADLRGNMDWSHYIDQFGGWKYDNVSGHDTADDESPHGVWLGLICVPEAFAEKAVELFPDQCEILDDAKAGDFYEKRHTVNQPEIHEDADTANALDPDHPHRGRRRNKTKRWDDYKTERGVVIDTAAVARLKRQP